MRNRTNNNKTPSRESQKLDLLNNLKGNRERKIMRNFDQQLSFKNQMRSIYKGGLGQFYATTPSTRAFIEVYANPFSKEDAKLPCVPVNQSLSQVYTANVQCHLNEKGIGWVTWYPANFCTQDVKALYYTSGPSATNEINITSSDVSAVTSDAPYLRSDFHCIKAEISGFRQLRIVSAGLRARYTGNLLNQQGRLYALQMNPDTLSVGGLTPDTISAIKGFKEYPFDGDFHGVIRHIVSVDDYEYLDYDPQYEVWKGTNDEITTVVPTWQDSIATMAIMVVGEPNSTFEVEASVHCEIAGQRIFNTSSVLPQSHVVEAVLATHQDLTHNTPKSTPDHNIPRGGEVDATEPFISKVGSYIEKAAGLANTVGHIAQMFL